jgi:ATP-dependent DNA helicase DinG
VKLVYNRFVVVDVETTGNLANKGDRIIQIGAVVIENGEIVQRFSSFINPETSIPAFITNLTCIEQSMVDNAPTFDEIAPELLKLLDGACFVAHNVPFDLTFIDQELTNSGYFPFRGPVLDTVEMARLLLPTLDSYKLSQLSEQLSFTHDNPHQADSDAEAAAKLLLFLLEKLAELPLLTLQKLQPLLRHFKSNLEDIVIELIQTKLSKIEEEQPEWDTYRQLVIKKMQEIQAEASVEETFSYKDTISDLLENMPSFEQRDGQFEMMDTIEGALYNGRHSIIEAGTGIGKSLGYLVPGLLFAKAHDRPIVVSTHTVPLQQQLLERDIPILEKIIPFDFETTILKGRNHYLCLRKYEQYLDDVQDDNYDVIFAKAQLLVWLVQSEFGDVEELNLPSGGNMLWQMVQSDTNSCLNHKCPWFSRCFYHRSKRKAQSADLIITNHALLFTDIAADHALIPSYKEVVVDEAHHMENVVSDHFGQRSDYFTFSRIFDLIGTADNTSGGLLFKLLSLLQLIDGKLTEADLFTMNNRLKQAKLEIDDLFRFIRDYVLERTKKTKSDVGRISYRYIPDRESENWSERVMDMVYRIKLELSESLKLLKKLVKNLEEYEDHFTVAQKGLIVDFQGAVHRLEDEKSKLETMLLAPDPKQVRWIEVQAKGAKNAVYLYSQPIDVSEMLSNSFFSKKNSVILTSATLTIKDSFSFIIDRLGLQPYDVETKYIPSPFNYEKQAQIMIPTDFPLIKDVSKDEFVTRITDSIQQIAEITNGRLLVLFTSYEMLKSTYFLLKQQKKENFNLIGQGIDSGSRAKLTKNFKQYDRAILFGTSSFWEGVDIPGEDLSCIVIVRLPFTPPDNPVMEARSEEVKKQRKNPFMELSLPEAIIRFKQGFGRLVRTNKDEGTVFVFDQRISTTRYGQFFLDSLPSVPVVKDDFEALLQKLKER